MQSLDNACKPNVSTQVSTQNLPLMTASFFIRTSKNNPTASIWIRITEGRGQQYRFNTGHRLLKASSWNKNTQSVRTVANESYHLDNLYKPIPRRKPKVYLCAIKQNCLSTNIYATLSTLFLKTREHFSILEVFMEIKGSKY